ncbi:pyruvate:ferredoxin (flavodoxin) oxidoreductase [Crateriforma spongiae]|uniref:pyruvate:ferredoxin (flavodoxin) oxidoreductase n=1 Tax=Crateriforma spongiae TaxID=2724528 RepID=UPI0039AECDD7
MSEPQYVTVDGNEAVARIAHLASEVIAIYPITPASSMGELADQWTSQGKRNVFGVSPTVIEMQSEAGAAGTVHGALQAGALSTTFTASQGLLLMIPEMYKIAGQLLPTVFHVAARSLATHALSIFGDHSDVMAARATGWAMLCSAGVQESQDFALISHAATLQVRVPFLHFFDGFRTSHEVSKIVQISEDDVRAMIDEDAVAACRDRALTPDHPVVRGTSQNPDVFFQSREAGNLYYCGLGHMLQATMDQFAKLTGRQYHLYQYEGAPDADRVIVIMGSGTGAVREAVQRLNQLGQKVGVLSVKLYRPLDAQRLIQALPDTVNSVAVLDRTKEPGAIGEPLYQDFVVALDEQWAETHRHRAENPPRVIGGRYGLSSKEFTPAMAARVFDELTQTSAKKHFTIGIYDDVTRLSLDWDVDFCTESDAVTRAVFYGLGSDGTVGASKNTVKIIGENTPLYAQGYFVYDSKKSGSTTVSHLRFGPQPIDSTYLIDEATFVGCNQFPFMKRLDVLKSASRGATVLLNSPYDADHVWDQLPATAQQQILDKDLSLYVVDAYSVAKKAGMGNRINTIMQTCFFALSDILPTEQAVDLIKESIRKTYGKRGDEVVQKNFGAVDAAIEGLEKVEVPGEVTTTLQPMPAVSGDTTEFVDLVTAQLIAGAGDLLPVSALPVDGTFPVGTSKFEKRSIAQEIPIWDADLCTACGLCSLVCPHAAIRAKVYPAELLVDAPESFASAAWKDKASPGQAMTIQVSPDDCTGCRVCVDVCPAKSKTIENHKAIDMMPMRDHADVERKNYGFFESIPEFERSSVKQTTVKGAQLLKPLFEFSGACSGCGETPYIKLMTQLFGDRAVIANATGCSSIFGGNLPTAPWTTDDEGRGPAWANSLFEDNSEFGLGIRLSIDHQRQQAEHLLRCMQPKVGDELVDAIIAFHGGPEAQVEQQRQRVGQLKQALSGLGDDPMAADLLERADALVPKSVWIVGGDGWAYDIGFGGLDHVISTGANVNILVLDTGVYSNTGGQNSKATPRAATAKFAAGGKAGRKKDLGMIAMSYGNAYVAQIAMGANPNQTMKVFHEAESFVGPSLILAYSPCIAHGIAMGTGMTHQKDVIASGLWPLYRHDPRLKDEGKNAFRLDSRKPKITFAELAKQEGRFAAVSRTDPQRAEQLYQLAQDDIDQQWRRYESLAAETE